MNRISSKAQETNKQTKSPCFLALDGSTCAQDKNNQIKKLLLTENV